MMVSMAEEVACTLTAADLAAQGNGWARLAARAMTGRALTDDGLRVSFRACAGDGVEDELRRLVAVERECCAWASWTVRADGADVVLEVRSAAPEGIAVLHGMLAGSLRSGGAVGSHVIIVVRGG
jgi:hypothetical protein